MTWACTQELPCNQKMVLLMLANRTNPDTGMCTPSHERLARDCGMSKTTVKECVAKLETAGLIEILRRYNEGVSLPNSYRLMMADGVGRQPTHPVGSDEGVGRQATGGGAPGDRGVGRQPATKQRVETEKETEKGNKGLPAPDGVSESVWADFLAVRKKKNAPITPTAMAGIEREASKAGYTLEDALRTCVERNWQGFRADWVADKQAPIRQPVRVTPQQAKRDDWRAQMDRLREQHNGEDHAERDDSTIDVEARVVGA
jgi:biotin operon repressor